jgi:hypothetical protein
MLEGIRQGDPEVRYLARNAIGNGDWTRWKLRTHLLRTLLHRQYKLCWNHPRLAHVSFW